MVGDAIFAAVEPWNRLSAEQEESRTFWTTLIVAWVISAVVCAIAGWFAAQCRDAGGLGAMLGGVLGPFGVIAALGLDGRPRCPRCAGRLDGQGHVCQHCRVALAWPNDGGPPKVAIAPEAAPKAAPQFKPAPDAAEEWAAEVLGTPKLPPLRKELR